MYLFYKVNGLKALVVSRGVAISKGRKSADDLRNILAGMGPPQEGEPAAQAEKQKRKKPPARLERRDGDAGDRPVDLLRRYCRHIVACELPGTRSVTSMSGLVLGPGSTTIVTRSE